MPFTVSAEGVAIPLPLHVFKLHLNDRVAGRNPATPDSEPNSDFATFAGRIRRRIAKPGGSEADAFAARSADLLMLGRDREVIESLKETLRARTLDFRLLAHMALAHAELGDWELALKRQADALLDGEEPAAIPGISPEQLKWMLKIDRKYTRSWMLAASRDASAATRGDDPDVPPLFAESKPADAIAVVQQLILWAPRDANLLWLLGSLYAAAEEWEEAFDILEQCREGRKMTWPKFRALHARAEAEFRKLPPKKTDFGSGPMLPVAVEPEQPKGIFDVVDKMQFGIVIFGFVVLASILIALQIRRFAKRRR